MMGVGRSNTPKSFVNACEVFVYTENLSPKEAKELQKNGKSHPKWTKAVALAIDMSSQDDGWALLSLVGLNLQKLDPAFDSRTFGHEKLSQLVRSCPALFEFKRDSPHYVVRTKS